LTHPVPQKHPVSSSRAAWISDGLVMALLAAVGGATHFLFGSERFYGENALFETGQNLMLFCGVAAFSIAARRDRKKSCQLIMWGLALVSAAMFLRELDVRGTDLERYLGSAFEHRLPYVALAILGVALVILMSKNVSETWRSGRQWLFSLPGAWFVTGLVLYAFGDASEKNLFTDKDHLAQMTEESAELLGTVFIFCASYVTLRRSTGLTIAQQTLSPDDER
jgi:hypothetical protein